MGKSLPIRLILASGSPARRELLDQAGYQFTVQPAGIDEPDGQGFSDPRLYVQTVAWLKAAAVATRLVGQVSNLPNPVEQGKSATCPKATVILAADTVGWLDGQVIGKPADEADAHRILTSLASREHELWTGCVLWRLPDNVQLTWQELSLVYFRPITEADLSAYLATRQWQGCSGAYAIQGADDPFVKLLSGSRSNVVGLPMESLANYLPLLSSPP